MCGMKGLGGGCVCVLARVCSCECVCIHICVCLRQRARTRVCVCVCSFVPVVTACSYQLGVVFFFRLHGQSLCELWGGDECVCERDGEACVCARTYVYVIAFLRMFM